MPSQHEFEECIRAYERDMLNRIEPQFEIGNATISESNGIMAGGNIAIVLGCMPSMTLIQI